MADDGYPLTRGSQQLIRVTSLQFIWRDALGYLLHPQITKDVAHVADVATATGVWLCELNKHQPQLQALDGYDISPASFIEKHNLSPKVNLHVLDATQPVPLELKGRYDVVHIRLVISVVRENDPSRFIEHCKDLLKPGGYLQWEECDPLRTEFDIAPGITRPSKLEGLQEILLGQAPRQWIGKLPEIFQRHNLNLVAAEAVRDSPWHRRMITGLFTVLWDEFATTVLDTQGKHDEAKLLRDQANEAFQEVLQGSTMAHLYQVVVAQKPH